MRPPKPEVIGAFTGVDVAAAGGRRGRAFCRGVRGRALRDNRLGLGGRGCDLDAGAAGGLRLRRVGLRGVSLRVVCRLLALRGGGAVRAARGVGVVGAGLERSRPGVRGEVRGRQGDGRCRDLCGLGDRLRRPALRWRLRRRRSRRCRQRLPPEVRRSWRWRGRRARPPSPRWREGRRHGECLRLLGACAPRRVHRRGDSPREDLLPVRLRIPVRTSVRARRRTGEGRVAEQPRTTYGPVARMDQQVTRDIAKFLP